MLALPCTESTVTDSAVTHGAEGYKSLGSGFDSELTEHENRVLRILIWSWAQTVRLDTHPTLAEQRHLRHLLEQIREKLREQARQHGWPVVGRDG